MHSAIVDHPLAEFFRRLRTALQVPSKTPKIEDFPEVELDGRTGEGRLNKRAEEVVPEGVDLCTGSDTKNSNNDSKSLYIVGCCGVACRYLLNKRPERKSISV